MSSQVMAEGETTVTPAGSNVLASAHSAIKFNLFAPPRKDGASAAGLLSQAQRVLALLEPAARNLHADALAHLPRFDLYIADAEQGGTMSSATGRIAINDAFAALRPTDDWMAFVVAREMAHVIAGHHAENSTASMLTSLFMNLVIPGTGLIKTALSLASSQLAAMSGRERQLGEADGIALRLLAAAGYSERDIALSLAVGPALEQLGSSSWAKAFAESSRTIVARVRGTPAAAPTQLAMEVAAPAAPSALVALMNASSLGEVRPPPPALAPEEVVLRGRPSGMPGMLLLGDLRMPPRRLE
ncbi:MAG: M48 family metalloprotease [Burkholderiales bacterium]